MRYYQGNVVKKKFPLTIQDFREIKDSNLLYVDKTKMLYELVNNCGAYLYTAPRAFGKTLLCSTIYYMFQGKEAKRLFEDTWLGGSEG